MELSYRLGKGNIVPVLMAQDAMRYYVNNGLANRLAPRRYANNHLPSQRCVIPLQGVSRLKLFVESGVSLDRNRIQRPYLKFEFNVDRLSCDETARRYFHRVMNDFLPGGGYAELVKEGNVLYAEFAYDIRGIDIHTIDVYSRRMQRGEWWIGPNERLQTIYLDDGRSKRREAFCVYDKKSSDRKRRHHVHRGQLLRIEAKSRFNNSQKYRGVTLPELGGIANPFESLVILDRAKVEQTFTAKRHTNFLSNLSRYGIQRALQGTTGADHERRLRMLEQCRVNWCNPQAAWAGVNSAIDTANLALEGELDANSQRAKARNPSRFNNVCTPG